MDHPCDVLPKMLESERNTAEQNDDFPILTPGEVAVFPKLKPNMRVSMPTVGAFMGISELVKGALKLNIRVMLLEKNTSFKATNKLWPEPGEIFEITAESDIHSDDTLALPAMFEVGVGPNSEN